MHNQPNQTNPVPPSMGLPDLRLIAGIAVFCLAFWALAVYGLVKALSAIFS